MTSRASAEKSVRLEGTSCHPVHLEASLLTFRVYGRLLLAQLQGLSMVSLHVGWLPTAWQWLQERAFPGRKTGCVVL